MSKVPNVSLITWSYNQVMGLHESDLSKCLFNSFVTLALFLGSLQIYSGLSRFLSFLNRQYLRGIGQKNKTFNAYGCKGSWAVVTGGSDGIGLAMCKKLAKEGFNIVIVARN